MIETGPAQPDDLGDILRIEQDGDASWSKAAFEDALVDGEWFLVARENRRPIGFAIGRFDGFDVELLKLSVSVVNRNRGVATALLLELLNMSKQKGAGVCHLEVDARNESAISLYRGLKFGLTGLRKAYYRTSDGFSDALLMAKDLK